MWNEPNFCVLFMGTTNLFPTFKWSFRELEKYSGCYWLEFWVQTVVGTPESGCALGFLISFSWGFLPLCCCFLFGGIGRGNVKQFVRNVFRDKSQPIEYILKLTITYFSHLPHSWYSSAVLESVRHICQNIGSTKFSKWGNNSGSQSVYDLTLLFHF